MVKTSALNSNTIVLTLLGRFDLLFGFQLILTFAFVLVATLFATFTVLLPAGAADPKDSTPMSTTKATAGASAASESWGLIAKGALADVYAEKRMYRRENSHFIYTHVQVRNKQGQDIDIDMSQGVIEPFSWRVAQREDEPEMMHDGPDLSTIPRPQLRKAAAKTESSKYLQVAKGKCLDYYTCFTASTCEEVEQQLKEYKCSWVIVTALGAIDARAGKKTEIIDGRNVNCGLDSRLGWSKLPAAAKVIGEL